MCAERGKVPDVSTISAYALNEGNLEFVASWKVLGHGSLDKHVYHTRELPRGGVTVHLRNFPRDKLRISALYVLDTAGRRSKPATVLSTLPDEPDSLRYRLPTGPDNFRLVLEGKSVTGDKFTLYSDQTYGTARFTDVELGKTFWRETWKTLGLQIPADRQRAIEQSAFPKVD